MKKEREYQVPKDNKPFFNFVKKILRLFYKRPEIINLNEGEITKSILVANHSTMKGPVVYELYRPFFYSMWGAGEMLEGYKSRFLYLRDVYFMQKRGYGKIFSSFLAWFEAYFSIMFYRGMRVMPTYRDARLMTTIKNSIKNLDANVNIMVYPENSFEGYKTVMTEFFSGFVILAEQYYKKSGEDLPVYPVYYSSEKRKIIIGKPSYCQELKKSGLTREQIADYFKDQVNGLYFEYIEKVDS